MDYRKRSSDASWTSVLLQTGPDDRGRLELGLDWASGLAWTSCWPPKVVAKEEDVQGLPWWVLQVLGVCSYLGQGPKDE